MNIHASTSGTAATSAVGTRAAGKAAPASLLPEPTSLTGPGIDSALGILYASMAQQRQNALVMGESRIQGCEDAEKQAVAAQRAAIQREQANEAHHGRGFFGSIGHLVGDVTHDLVHFKPVAAVKDGATDVRQAVQSPAFWNDLEQGALMVAKVAAVVGSVTATAATGGAAGVTLAATAVLLSVGGEVVSRTKCFGKGSEAVGLGLDIGGAVAGFGTSLLPTDAVNEGLKAVSIASNSASAGATMVGGAAHIENANFAAAVQSAAADATAAVDEDDRMTQLQSWIVSDAQTDDKRRQSTLDATRGAVQASDKAHAAAAAGIAPTALKG